MSFTQTFLVQCLLFIPLPYILFAAFKSRRVMPLAVLQVLGAILREMDLLSHHIGQLALSLAAMNDAALWVMLTLLLAVSGSPGSAPALLLLLPAYLGVMFWIVPRLLDRVATRLTTRDGL